MRLNVAQAVFEPAVLEIETHRLYYHSTVDSATACCLFVLHIYRDKPNSK